MIDTFSPRFAPALFYKRLLYDGGKHLRLYEPCENAIRGANALVRVHEPPAGPQKMRLLQADAYFWQNSGPCAPCIHARYVAGKL